MAITLKLQIDGLDHPDIINPNAYQILTALRKIEGTDNSFMILSKNELTYIQTDGVAIEYQEGTLKEHYYSKEGFKSPEYAAQFFLSYASNSD